MEDVWTAGREDSGPRETIFETLTVAVVTVIWQEIMHARMQQFCHLFLQFYINLQLKFYILTSIINRVSVVTMSTP